MRYFNFFRTGTLKLFKPYVLQKAMLSLKMISLSISNLCALIDCNKYLKNSFNTVITSFYAFRMQFFKCLQICSEVCGILHSILYRITMWYITKMGFTYHINLSLNSTNSSSYLVMLPIHACFVISKMSVINLPVRFGGLSEECIYLISGMT